MESYERFDLDFRVDDAGRVSVCLNRAGSHPQPFELSKALVARLAEPDLAPTPEEIGSELFRALFHGSLARELQKALERLRRDEVGGVRLRLVLDPTEPELARISALPWELLYDADEGHFFGQDPRTPIVRFLSLRSAGDPQPTDPPLKILLAYAEPRGLDKLRLEAEMERLYDAAGRADVQLHLMRVRSPWTLRETLDRGRFDILHFMGHGLVDRRTGVGSLLCEDARGGPREVSGRELAHALRGIPTLRLAVLNACDTAAPVAAPGLDPYAGVATALVRAGIPAVLAMRSGISDADALACSETLYQRLAQRDSIEEAVARARLRLVHESREPLAWATPSLYLQSMDGDLFDLSGRKRRGPPWWNTWPVRGAAAGLLLGLLFWLMATERPRSPANASAYLTNPLECKPLIPKLNLHFVRIETGVAYIGSQRKDDLPKQLVQVWEPFCLAKYEVTRWQWWYVMERPDGVPEPPAEEQSLPAEGVSYHEAGRFIRRLNQLVSRRLFRLPLETEWELAATRGFPDFDRLETVDLRRYANCGSWLRDGKDAASRVGALDEDRLGLFDMLGNVFEWVETTEPRADGKVIRRGGSYASGEGECRPQERRPVLPDRQQYATGLRLVREIRNP